MDHVMESSKKNPQTQLNTIIFSTHTTL